MHQTRGFPAPSSPWEGGGAAECAVRGFRGTRGFAYRQHGCVDVQLSGQQDEDPGPFRGSAPAEQQRFPGELWPPVLVIGIELNVADRPVEQAPRPLPGVLGVAARPTRDVPQPYSFPQGEPVEAGILHLVQVLDLRQFSQRLRQRRHQRIEPPILRRLLRANPPVEPVDNLAKHFRLRPGCQQGIDTAVRLIRFRVFQRFEPFGNLPDDVGRVELFQAVEVIQRVGEQLLAVLFRPGGTGRTARHGRLCRVAAPLAAGQQRQQRQANEKPSPLPTNLRLAAEEAYGEKTLTYGLQLAVSCLSSSASTTRRIASRRRSNPAN